MSHRLRHERNLSDGSGSKVGGALGVASSGGVKGVSSSATSGKEHRRNLSDTQTNGDQLGVFPEVRIGSDE